MSQADGPASQEEVQDLLEAKQVVLRNRNQTSLSYDHDVEEGGESLHSAGASVPLLLHQTKPMQEELEYAALQTLPKGSISASLILEVPLKYQHQTHHTMSLVLFSDINFFISSFLLFFVMHNL